jgi:hypothetical protein
MTAFPDPADKQGMKQQSVSAGFLTLFTWAMTVAPTAAQGLPATAPLSEIELSLRTVFQGGGCVDSSRCPNDYRVIIHGNGLVEFEAQGAEPRPPSRSKTISTDQVVLLLDQFVRAHFFEGPTDYKERRTAVRRGDAVEFGVATAVDGTAYELSARVGALSKTAFLYIGIPSELARLRDLMIDVGGPAAWPR